MNFTVRQNSTYIIEVDPSQYCNQPIDWGNRMPNAIATFSMVQVDTGCYVVANKAAEVVVVDETGYPTDGLGNAGVSCTQSSVGYLLRYTLTSHETRLDGIHLAGFSISFTDNEELIAIPEARDIQIVITESLVSGPLFGDLPQLSEIDASPIDVPIYTSGSTFIPKTYAELRSLIVTASLVEGQEYLMYDYRTTHRIPGSSEVNNGPNEGLVLQAMTKTSFHRVVKSVQYPQDIIHYDFMDDFVRCNDSFDQGDVFCVDDNSLPRTGYIKYRKDTVLNNSAFYDFRAYKNNIAAQKVSTFGSGCSNIEIGLASGNVILSNVSNVKIGDNCKSIMLGRVAASIVIGNNVKFINTGTMSIPVHVLNGSKLTIEDNGTDGSIKTAFDLSDDSIGFEGITNIAFLPKDGIVTSIDVVSSGVDAQNTILSFGMDEDPANIVENRPLSTLSNTAFNAQISSPIAENNTYARIRFLGLTSTTGYMVVKFGFSIISNRHNNTVSNLPGLILPITFTP